MTGVINDMETVLDKVVQELVNNIRDPYRPDALCEADEISERTTKAHHGE